MYALLRPLLFSLDAERSHDLTLSTLGLLDRCHLEGLLRSRFEGRSVSAFGLHFPNPIGLAAGLDKNADAFNALGALGFGFVEVGTVTPRAQPGNPKPRMFRLEEQRAIINRMGFNNKGASHLANRVKSRRYTGVLGINIGKNKDTDEDNALSDYKKAMDAVYEYADYLTVNISSPNTPGLRDLQYGDALQTLLSGLQQHREALAEQHQCRKPLLVKIAPDMNEDALKSIADAFIRYGVDGVIATNTTLDRSQVEGSPFIGEAGGLSGMPVRERATACIRVLSEHSGESLPVVGVGGVMSGKDVVEKLEAGAVLVQLYSGLIYRGPELVREAVLASQSAKR